MVSIFRPSASLLIALALGLLPTSNCAQSLPNKKEVSEWARNSLKSSDLASADSSPYHLVAKVHYTLGDKTLDGTYEILWAARDRYRLEMRIGDTGETDVLLGDKKYIVRNTPTMTVQMLSLTTFLFGPRPISPAGTKRADSAYKVYFAGEGTGRQICGLFGENLNFEHEFCFDANKQLLSRRDHPRTRGGVPKGAYWLEMTDYVALGNLRYPHQLSRRAGPESIDVQVEKWEAVKQFDAKVFVPPPNSTAWDVCDAPEIKRSKDEPPESLTAFHIRAFIGTGDLPYLAVYYRIGADGVAKQITELFSSPESAMNEIMSQQQNKNWPMHLCEGKPVEYENIFMFWPLLPRTN